jgi:plastocyanin
VRRILLASLLVLLAGCGGDDDEPGRTATVPASGQIEVIADEYSFDPETLVAQAGELTISLKNEGALAHNLRVVRGDDEVGGTPTFQGGETKAGTVTVEPGTYELVCTVGNHADLGMTGKLEVR